MIHPLRLAAVLASFLLLGAAALEPQRDALARDPEYIVLDSDADAFRERFNADVGKTRILMLVSPTCGGCLRGADQTQKKVLSRIDSDGLAAYAVWVPANSARERHMPRVTKLVHDPRATEYWDEYDVVEDWYRDMLDFDGPCAGIFMIYGPDARWDGEAPPEPDYWEDAHSDLRAVELAPQFKAKRFEQIVRDYLP